MEQGMGGAEGVEGRERVAPGSYQGGDPAEVGAETRR